MLYSLFSNLIDVFSFFNVFKYLTVRTGLAMFTSMFVVFLVGTPFINFFSARQMHSPIREDGPEEHIIKKIGTPTMGGLLILLGLFSGVLLWGDLLNPYIWFLIYIVGSFGLLGAYDDYKKIKVNNSSGISLKLKIISQITLAFFGILILIYFVDSPELKNLYFPFFKNFINPLRLVFYTFLYYCYCWLFKCSKFNRWIRWFSYGSCNTCGWLFCIYKLCNRKYCFFRIFTNTLH